jgi:hypothetical protein
MSSVFLPIFTLIAWAASAALMWAVLFTAIRAGVREGIKAARATNMP